MTLTDASEVSAFLARGGRIVKVQEAILATRQDVLDYLQSCGVPVNYSKSDPGVCSLKRKRMNLDQLVVMANRQRRTQQLRPFAVQP